MTENEHFLDIIHGVNKFILDMVQNEKKGKFSSASPNQVKLDFSRPVRILAYRKDAKGQGQAR